MTDYQEFALDEHGQVINIGERMRLKMKAIELPDLAGLDVLDVGCDGAFWSFLASNRGAKRVLGLDRNRIIRDVGLIDLIHMNRATVREYPQLGNCEFERIDLGKQWKDFGKFHVIFLFSLYHHIYQNTGGDHLPIWFWLWRHLKPRGVLLWENPVGTDDGVVQKDVSKEYHRNYTMEAIAAAASQYFKVEPIGHSLHEPTRWVYQFRPKTTTVWETQAKTRDGAGGATKAFLYRDGRRMKEIEAILGYEPYPGSLNLVCEADFPWNENYYRAQILDVKDRKLGLESEWAPRWGRFYPVEIGQSFFQKTVAHAFRFEGERYPEHFVELIGPTRLRGHLNHKEESLGLRNRLA